MGGTRDYYAMLLKQKLREAHENKFDAQGRLLRISNQDLEKVLKDVKKDLDRKTPKKSQMGKAFKKFCEEQRNMDNPKKLAHDEKSKKLFGSGRSYDQYKKNRDELLKSCIQSIKKEIAWNNAEKNLNLKGANGTPVKLDGVRWKDFLVRTDGTHAAERNEELYALLALGQKKITKEQFIQLRKKHYMDPANGTMSNEEAEKQATRESERVGERILEMVKEELERTKEDRKKMASYTTMILNGTAGQKGYPTLEECHRVVDNEDLQLAWDLQKMVADLKVLGGLNDPEAATKFAIDNQIKAGQGGSNAEMAEMASNYYFVMIDPFKVIDQEDPMSLSMPLEDLNKPDAILRKAFGDSCLAQYGALRQMAIDEGRSFGLMQTDRMIVYPDKNPPMRVIRHEATDEQGNKSIRTAIMRAPRLTDVGGAVAVYANQPENLVNSGLEASVNGFIDTCKDWPREGRTSPEFEAMRDALENLQNKKLIMNPNPYEIEALQKNFQKLLDTSNDYYAYKVGQRHGEHFKRGFETTRVKFSKELHEFAKQKLEELQYVKEHMETLEQAKKEKKNLKDDPEYQAKVAAGYQGGPLGYLREKEEERKRAQRQLAEEQQEREQQAENQENNRKQEKKEPENPNRRSLVEGGFKGLEQEAGRNTKENQIVRSATFEKHEVKNPLSKGKK